jgi:hypothetical protein
LFGFDRPLTNFAILVGATTVADGYVAGDSLLPSAVGGSIFIAGVRSAGVWCGPCIGSLDCSPVDSEHDGASLWKDLCHHRDWEHTPTPQKDAVVTNRESFSTWAYKSDERPDAFPPRFQHRVLLGGLEQFPNPLSVISVRRCRGTHNRQ